MKLSAPVYQLKHRAKRLARNNKLSLHQALDRIARSEGYRSWSHLSSQIASKSNSTRFLPRLANGEILLFGARPGQGKTLKGLKFLLEAAGEGRRAVFFTLEYSEKECLVRLRTLEKAHSDCHKSIELVASDEICADYIIRHLAGSKPGTVAVIDYLQILDQQRAKPSLSEQILELQEFAQKTGIVLVFLSQIDRSFDPETKSVPDLRDVRLPNPVDLRLFAKACFTHGGKTQFLEVA